MKKIGIAAINILVLVIAGGRFFMRSMVGMSGNMPGQGGGR
ncbi:hypothetical protein [Mesobacillus sp.]